MTEFGYHMLMALKTNCLYSNLAFLSLFSLQEVKRAVVGFFTNNDTTAYMSFAKVSHKSFV